MPKTSPGSPQTLFATTRWTLVCQASSGGDTAASHALETLFATYWKPLYRYLRRLGQSPADAEDLVQGFFAHLLENEGLRNADRAKGRFRAFLLGALKNFSANQWHRERRQKRGGSALHLSLDWKSAETGLSLEPADLKSPDRLFDRDWALALLDKVLDDLAREESGVEFERWKPFLSVSSARISYAEIANEMGISEGNARVAVHRLRKRYRQRLRDEIARTLNSSEQVEEEMRVLFEALAL